MEEQMVPVTEYLEMLRQQLALRGFTESATRTYFNAVSNFLRWLIGNQRSLTRESVVDYLLHVVNDQRVVPGTQRTYLMSIRFLARKVLGRPELVANIRSRRFEVILRLFRRVHKYGRSSSA